MVRFQTLTKTSQGFRKADRQGKFVPERRCTNTGLYLGSYIILTVLMTLARGVVRQRSDQVTCTRGSGCMHDRQYTHGTILCLLLRVQGDGQSRFIPVHRSLVVQFHSGKPRIMKSVTKRQCLSDRKANVW